MKTEDRIQQEIFTHHWNNYPDERQQLFAVHNNAHNRIKGAKNASIGVVAGVSDMVYLRDGKVFFVEIKTERGRQSPSQKTFEEKCKKNSNDYIIIHSLEEAKEVFGWTR